MKKFECFQNSQDEWLGNAGSVNVLGGDIRVLKMTGGTRIAVRNSRFGVQKIDK
jgi:hypothetical protein